MPVLSKLKIQIKTEIILIFIASVSELPVPYSNNFDGTDSTGLAFFVQARANFMQTPRQGCLFQYPSKGTEAQDRMVFNFRRLFSLFKQ